MTINVTEFTLVVTIDHDLYDVEVYYNVTLQSVSIDATSLSRFPKQDDRITVSLTVAFHAHNQVQVELFVP